MDLDSPSSDLDLRLSAFPEAPFWILHCPLSPRPITSKFISSDIVVNALMLFVLVPLLALGEPDA